VENGTPSFFLSSRDLQKVEQPFSVFEENGQVRCSPATRRADDMFEQVKTKLPGAPKFLLCAFAERKNSDVYGWF
jgi:eukaryotic translation initiation factor 2C